MNLVIYSLEMRADLLALVTFQGRNIVHSLMLMDNPSVVVYFSEQEATIRQSVVNDKGDFCLGRAPMSFQQWLLIPLSIR